MENLKLTVLKSNRKDYIKRTTTIDKDRFYNLLRSEGVYSDYIFLPSSEIVFNIYFDLWGKKNHIPDLIFLTQG